MVLPVHEVEPCVDRTAVDRAHNLLPRGRPLTSARSLRLVKALRQATSALPRVGLDNGAVVDGGGACPVEDTKSTAWDSTIQTVTLYMEIMYIGAVFVKTTKVTNRYIIEVIKINSVRPLYKLFNL